MTHTFCNWDQVPSWYLREVWSIKICQGLPLNSQEWGGSGYPHLPVPSSLQFEAVFSPWLPALEGEGEEDEKLGACFLLHSNTFFFGLLLALTLGHDTSLSQTDLGFYQLAIYLPSGSRSKASWASVSYLQNGHLSITQPVWWMICQYWCFVRLTLSHIPSLHKMGE